MDKEHRKEYMKKYYEVNKKKIKERSRKYYVNNTNKARSSHNKYVAQNKELITEYKHEWYTNNKNEILKNRKEYYRKNYNSIKEYMHGYFIEKYSDVDEKIKMLDACKAYRHKLKSSVIMKLGGRCNCCGESEQEFLTVDHIHENGGVHRRQLRSLGKSGMAVYRIVRDAENTSDYQLLCWNCNISKHYGGGICRHKRIQ